MFSLNRVYALEHRKYCTSRRTKPAWRVQVRAKMRGAKRRSHLKVFFLLRENCDVYQAHKQERDGAWNQRRYDPRRKSLGQSLRRPAQVHWCTWSEAHASQSPNNSMSRGNRKSKIRSSRKPRSTTKLNTSHGKDECLRTVVEVCDIDDSILNRLGHASSQDNRTSKFRHHGESTTLFHAQCIGRDSGGIGIWDIAGAISKDLTQKATVMTPMIHVTFLRTAMMNR